MVRFFFNNMPLYWLPWLDANKASYKQSFVSFWLGLGSNIVLVFFYEWLNYELLLFLELCFFLTLTKYF